MSILAPLEAFGPRFIAAMQQINPVMATDVDDLDEHELADRFDREEHQ